MSMYNGITVVGMVSSQHLIEDLRMVVPYRVAVQIPANMVQMSEDLKDAIQQKKVMRLSGVLPNGVVIRGAGPVKRAGAPHPALASQPNGAELRDLKAQVKKLALELAAAKKESESSREELATSKERETQLQTLNFGLQSTLTGMAAQLTAIQGAVGELQKRGITVVAPGSLPTFQSEVEDDIPMFIPSVAREADKARVNITVTEKSSSTDLAANKAALKDLRKAKS